MIPERMAMIPTTTINSVRVNAADPLPLNLIILALVIAGAGSLRARGGTCRSRVRLHSALLKPLRRTTPDVGNGFIHKKRHRAIILSVATKISTSDSNSNTASSSGGQSDPTTLQSVGPGHG